MWRSQKNKEGIKGRHFEICGCGGFQLSFYVRGLNIFYEIDKEIAVYENIDSIADYIRFYLMDEELRAKIAQSGYERSVKEHSSRNYLMEMVRQASD
jgi:spore maturation protein CgeB